VRARGLAGLLLFAAGALFADPREFGVPPPRGWIGTTSQWVQGVGILFAVFNLVLLVVIWRILSTRGITAISKALLFGAIFVVPLVVVFLATAHGMEKSMTVEACGGCHVMEKHVADLKNPKSETLAALHYKNRFIQANHCYTCHSDYGMAGTFKAKIDGLGHTVRNATGSYELPLKIAHPFSNLRCLSCHGGAQRFLEKHDKDTIPDLLADKTSCLECHGPPHPREGTKQAMR
jgi:nitrate/TMAO reductase-like tetraheme cytochrome c subunit